MLSPWRWLSALVLVGSCYGNDTPEQLFGKSFYNVSVSEDVPPGTCILKVFTRVRPNVTYSLQPPGRLAWKLNSDGELCVVGNLDYELNPVVDLALEGRDLDGSTATTAVRIHLLNVNDNDPTFSPVHYDVTLTDPVGLRLNPNPTPILTVMATDPDSSASLKYRLDGNGADLFRINDSGSLWTTSNLKPGTYDLRIFATDPDGRTGEGSVKVTSGHVHGPKFSQSRYSWEVKENTILGSVVGTVSVQGHYNKVTYDLFAGNELGWFKINERGQIGISKSIDYETASRIMLQVRAREEAVISYVQVEISILDENDSPPVFSNSRVKISVSEATPGGSTVYVVMATDVDSQDSGHVTYTLLSGNAEGVFYLEKSGELHLSPKGLDFENGKEHHLIIGAVDGGVPHNRANVTVLIEVLDANDNGPKFVTEKYHLTVSESLPLNSELIEVKAEDLDGGNNGRITYHVEGEDQRSLFDIGPKSGLLILKGTLDRETVQKHVVKILAVDHGLPSRTGTATVTLTVQDENDHDPIFEETMYKFSIDENCGSGSFVGRVVGLDRDSGDNGIIRYFIQEGVQSGFEIDVISGVIRTTQNLDREKISRYELQVGAHDLGHNPQRQSEVIVQIKVNDQNDCRPRFVELEEGRVLVREDEPEGTVVLRVVAKDEDAGDNGTVTYGLAHEDFTIDPVSGVVRTRRPLHYDQQSSYSLQVVSRDRGIPPLESMAEYRVEVVSLDDALNFVQGPGPAKLTFEVSETSPLGNLIGSARLPSEAEARLTFDLARANSSDGTFELDKRTGNVYVATPLDYEVTSEYSLQVKVSDQSGTTLRHVTILVLDENDEPPTFSEDPIHFHVAEDVPIGTAVWNLSAQDLDRGVNGVVHYALTLQLPSDKFRLNPLTGRLTVNQQLDYESDTEFILVVTATDQPSFVDRRLRTGVTVRITVDDVNDNYPRFVSPSTVTVSKEDTGVLFTVLAVDDDDGHNSLVTYSFDVPTGFEVHPVTGDVSAVKPMTVGQYGLNVTATDGGAPSKSVVHMVHLVVVDTSRKVPRFEKTSYVSKIPETAPKGTLVTKIAMATEITLTTTGNNTVVFVLPEAQSGQFGIHPISGALTVTGPLDRETVPEYNLTVHAFDTQMIVRYDTTVVTVIVSDVNDSPPRLFCANLVLPENVDLGVVHRFGVVDPDLSRNADVTFAITHGNDEGVFKIDQHNGTVTSKRLDRERRAGYHLVVTAQDQGLPAHRTSCNVTVTVLDENDCSPEFGQREYRVRVSEEAPVGATVLTVTAMDADVGQNDIVTYSLANVTSAKFRIEEQTGRIFLAGTLDRETVPDYSFEVVASNGGVYNSRWSTARVTVVVIDVNDNPPRFGSHVTVIEVPADTKPGTRIGQVAATDGDNGINSDISYSLDPSGSSGTYKVDRTTGVITVDQTLTNDAGKVVNLRVIAKDHGIPALSSVSVVQLVVGSVPVSATMRFLESKYEAKVVENSAQGTTIVKVNALRNDGRRQTVKYDLVAGNELKGFFIDPASGQVTVMNSTVMDREVNPNFTLIVRAQTESAHTPLTVFTSVHIMLEDENDSSPEFHQDFYSAAVLEGNSKGEFVIQVSASDDDDTGANSRLTYFIIDGNDDNAFRIDNPHSGVVKTSIVLDREIREEYRLVVMATDEGIPQLTGSCVIKIKVIDINDNVPTFPPLSEIFISESAPVGTLVTTLISNDVDSHPNSFFTMELPSDTFALGKFDGKVWLLRELDYETVNQYRIPIRVSDSAHETVADLRITVVDFNDNSPKFQKPAYEAVVSASTEVGTEIAHVTATDADTPAVNRGLKFTLDMAKNPRSRGLAGRLRIDETGTIYTNGSIATGLEPGFVETTVTCSDMGNPPRHSKVTVWIQIRTGTLEAIKFSQAKYTVELSRDQAIGAVVLQLDTNHRTDPNTVDYSIVNGNPNSTFAIDRRSGEVRLLKRFQPETLEYVITVALHCSDPLPCVANATVVITSTDLNPILFNQSVYSVILPERKPIGSTLFKFEPIQPNRRVAYTLTSGISEKFELNLVTGALTLKHALDYGKTKSYKLTVLARSARSMTVVTLHLEVDDANDHAPQFLLSSYLEFVPENETPGTEVFRAKAVDSDGSFYGNVSYSILETSANQKFVVDSVTGLVTTGAVFDYETINRFQFTLRAVDRGGLAATVKVQVDVTSRDEYTPVFRQKQYRWTVPSNAQSGYVLGTVRATDEDQGIDGTVVYSITSPNGDAFRINRTTGAVSLKTDLRHHANTSLVLTASSGQLDSKSASVTAQVIIGPPSLSLGSSTTPGISQWLIGALVTALLLVFVLIGLGLLFYFKQTRGNPASQPDPKTELSFGSNFDTLAYTAHSTMLAGATRPNSMYSPQYSDLVEVGRHGGRNPGSDLSEKSQNSASSGRGSAEEEDDEEIRMINEGRLEEQKLRESLGLLPDSGMHEGSDDSSVKNTQEYLARLGIRPMPEDSDYHQAQLPFDLSLIYAQIPEDDPDGAGVGHDTQIRFPDHLQNWGPQYQPLAHVFSEIARLNEDVASGHYNGVIGQSSNNSVSGKSDSSSKRGKKKPSPAPPIPLPTLPRSPITADLSYSSPMPPSFSPELSFCNALPVLHENSIGIRTTGHLYPHTSYASSESSEQRV